MFGVILIAVGLGTALLPQIIKAAASYMPTVKLHKSYDRLPILAAVLFEAAFYLPDIHISSETNTFQQHFIGGGVYAALLFVYVSKLLNWRLVWPLALAALFAWTSALGVANELMEFTLTKLGLARIGTGDTDWDLLANTLGALTGYISCRTVMLAPRAFKRSAKSS